MTRFVVLSLPRSRSYWMSRFLSFDGREVAHDPSMLFTDRRDIATFFRNPEAAACDTALGMIWHKIKDQMPADLRVAVVHRPVAEVVASLRRVGLDRPGLIEQMNEFAERLETIPGRHYRASEFDGYMRCASLFEYCLGGATLPASHWTDMRGRRLECDHATYRRIAHANAHGIRAVYGRELAA